MTIIIGLAAAGLWLFAFVGVCKLLTDPTDFDYPGLDGNVYDDRAIDALVEDVLLDRRNR